MARTALSSEEARGSTLSAIGGSPPRRAACALACLSGAVLTLASSVAEAVAPAVDAVTTDDTGDAASSITKSHTTSGSDRLLLVCVAILDPGAAVSTLTYGGTSLTSVGARQTGGNPKTRMELWRLIAPATGANDVVVTLDQAADRFAIAAISLTGVNQSTPLGTFVSAFNNNSAAPSLSGANVVASASGELVVDCLAAGGTPTATVDASQTDRWNVVTGGVRCAGSTEAGAATVAMDWTLSGSGQWAIGGVSVKPLPGTRRRVIRW